MLKIDVWTIESGNICIYDTDCIYKAGGIIEETQGVVHGEPQWSRSSPISDVKPEVPRTINYVQLKKQGKFNISKYF